MEQNLARKYEMANLYSHGLRTPLNAIIGFAQLIIEESEESETLKSYAHHIIHSANDLLLFSDGVIIDWINTESYRNEKGM